MKVLVSAYACDPTRGGEFGNGWCYADNAGGPRQVWCLTTTEGKDAIDDLLARHPRPHLHMVYVHVPRWLLTLKVRSPQVGVYFHYMYWQYKAWLKARQLNAVLDFDLVHHATYASLQLGSFLWRLNKPMLFGPVGGGQKAPVAFKGYFYRWWRLERWRDRIEFVLLHVFRSATRAVRHANLTLVVNEDTHTLARRHHAQRIAYAPCTLLPDNFGPAVLPERAPGRTLKVLWVGRLLARKGLRLVLEALAQVDPSVPVKLTVIGDGALSEQLPLWLKELNLQERVEWLGRQPLQNVKEAYASHDVFIYCSLRESLAAQFFEAMAYGLPMIIFDLHGARTFIPDDVAIKVPVTNPMETVSEMKNAIVYLHRNAGQRRSMGALAFKASRQFLRSRRLEIINQYYSELARVAKAAHPASTNAVARPSTI